MNYVVDACVAIKWFIPEIHWQKATLLQDYPSSKLHAPDFIQLECTNILSKKVRRKELSVDAANTVQAFLLQMPVQLHSWQSLWLEAAEVAQVTYRSIYDCLYLVLAKQVDGQMVTADKKFYRGIQDSSDWAKYVLWIEDIEPYR